MNYRDVRPLIATPCYGGLVHEGYMRGLTSFVASAIDLGMGVNLSTVINESLITRARNELVKFFMMSDSTHMIFIDADIQFEAADVLRLISHDKDIVVGSYPLKGVRWDNIKSLDGITDVEEVRRLTIDQVVNFRFDNEEDAMAGRIKVVDDLVEVDTAGTGFMCIKRNVIERMIKEIPNLEYKKEPRFLISGKPDDGGRWAVFDTEIEGERYLSEDYLFCRRWQRLGGQVWLDPTILLTHWGTYAFEGREYFKFTEQAPVEKPEVLGSPAPTQIPSNKFLRG
jgi:hypothetical protein